MMMEEDLSQYFKHSECSKDLGSGQKELCDLSLGVEKNLAVLEMDQPNTFKGT
jgi:hypothetical protein